MLRCLLCGSVVEGARGQCNLRLVCGRALGRAGLVLSWQYRCSQPEWIKENNVTKSLCASRCRYREHSNARSNKYSNKSGDSINSAVETLVDFSHCSSNVTERIRRPDGPTSISRRPIELLSPRRDPEAARTCEESSPSAATLDPAARRIGPRRTFS